jgi:hypothetical protein
MCQYANEKMGNGQMNWIIKDRAFTIGTLAY